VNILRAILGGVKEINTTDYHKQFDDRTHIVLDVRNPHDFTSEHIKGAINIPFNKLPKKLDKLPDDQPIICVCQDGLRGREAAYMLQKKGYEATNIVGGILKWRTTEPTVSDN
jgi:rhodanese-related sulfurtransferase